MIKWIVGKLVGKTGCNNTAPINALPECLGDACREIAKEVGHRLDRLVGSVENLPKGYRVCDEQFVVTVTLIGTDKEESYRKFIHYVMNPPYNVDVRYTTEEGDVEVWLLRFHYIDRRPKSDTVDLVCRVKMIRKFHPA